MSYVELLKHWRMLAAAFSEHSERLVRYHAMGDKPTLVLAASEPPPEMEQTVLRLRADALILRNTMTPAQARSAFLIVEKARDDLSAVLDRAEFRR